MLSKTVGAEPGEVLAPELLAEAEEQAALLIRCGFDTPEEIAEQVSDYFEDGDGSPVSVEAAREIVGRLWRERLAEQAGWPAETDADRVAAAFRALEAGGVTARMHFTCCSTCGTAEIGGEAAQGDRGFVFFHCQHTEQAADGGGLWLLYGAYDGAAGSEGTAAVGREIVTALTRAGLSVEWDGDPARSIRITPLDWRKRLPEPQAA